jgi:signal peptidase II
VKDTVLNTVLKKNITSLIIVFAVFLSDRISKYIILKLSQPLGELNISVTSFLNFHLIWNNGIAFGLFSFKQDFYYNLITLLIISITSIIIWLSYKAEGLQKISYLMIIGGSLGNIFDRIIYSSVLDFIDISINNFHWFIFNVADIFITIGVILLIILEFLTKKTS